MSYLELFIIAVGLSMDAFAVSICKGLNMKKVNPKHCFLIALFFGGFQAVMPLIGWLLGSQFEQYIVSIDHWIAFVLLALIGGNMLKESFEKEEEEEESADQLDIKELFLLAIATSIDALAVGVTFAFLSVNILPAVSMIGITTFCFAICGVFIGNIFGSKYKSKAEFAGGLILILMGLKILLEHLGYLNF